MYLCLFLSKWHISWGEEILKSPTIIELCLDYILKSSSMLFMKWGMVEFNTFMFGIVMFSGLIFPLIRMKYPLLYLWIDFSFNPGFSDIKVETPACFLVPFAWNILSLSFHSKMVPILKANQHQSLCSKCSPRLNIRLKVRPKTAVLTSPLVNNSTVMKQWNNYGSDPWWYPRDRERPQLRCHLKKVLGKD